MRAAELIDLMMYLVIYPCLVILYTIVKQCLIDKILMESVNNLKEEYTLLLLINDVIKVYH